MLHNIPEHRALLSVELPFCVTPLHPVKEQRCVSQQEDSLASSTVARVDYNEESEKQKKGGEGRKRRRKGNDNSSEHFCSSADRRRIQSFLPAAELFRCLTSEEGEWEGETSADGAVEGNPSRALSKMNEERATGDGVFRAAPSLVSFSSAEDQASDRKGENAKHFSKKDNGKREGPFSFSIAHNRLYRPDPLWNTWRGTDWTSDDDEEDEEEADAGSSFSSSSFVPQAYSQSTRSVPHLSSHRSSSEKWRARGIAPGVQQHQSEEEQDVFSEEAIFPSSTPQILLNGYYRNDLLVRVRQRYRVRQIRNRTTGEILREEEIESDGDQMKKDENVFLSSERDVDRRPLPSTRSQPPRLETTVLGVVSREVELARPADFAFSLFTKAEKEQAPFSCHGDVFPPSHFLSPRGPFELKYEMGLQVNTAVLAAEHWAKSACSLSQGIGSASTTGEKDKDDDLSGPSSSSEPGGALTRRRNKSLDSSEDPSDLLYIPLLTVHPDTDDTGIPPPPLPQQVEFLRRVGSSPSGLAPEDPEEVKAVATLLQARPIWAIKELQEAALQTGVCPRGHFNKRVIHSLTYVIPVGAFNRLRIRLGFNPYSNPLNVLYQRIAVRLHRRSAVGMLLRDISRSEKIEQVIHELRHRKDDPIPLPWTIKNQPAILTSSNDHMHTRQNLTVGARGTAENSQVHPSSRSEEEVLDVRGVPRCSLREHFCRTILRGQLSIYFQLIDCIESHAHQRLVEQTLRRWRGKSDEKKKADQSRIAMLSSSRGDESVEGTSNATDDIRLPFPKRKEPSGWLTEHEYSRALSSYTSALVHFIEEEAIPLLKEMLQMDEDVSVEKDRNSLGKDDGFSNIPEGSQSTTVAHPQGTGENDLAGASFLEGATPSDDVFPIISAFDRAERKEMSTGTSVSTFSPKKTLLEGGRKKEKVQEAIFGSNEEGESEDENTIGVGGSMGGMVDGSSSSSSSSFGSSHASRNSSMASNMDAFSSDESIEEF